MGTYIQDFVTILKTDLFKVANAYVYIMAFHGLPLQLCVHDRLCIYVSDLKLVSKKGEGGLNFATKN